MFYRRPFNLQRLVVTPKVLLETANVFIDGLGPALQIAEGWAVTVDAEVHAVLNERTNETWPTTWFVPPLAGNARFRDVYTVMLNWGSNHGAIGYSITRGSELSERVQIPSLR